MSRTIADLPIVTERSADFLDETQYDEYREHRRQFLSWMLTLGKDPIEVEGYAFDTTRYHAYRLVLLDGRSDV